MSQLIPGLCSVTLRALTIDDVVRLADETDLRAVEWGGDVHVPPGDAAAAHRARVAASAANVTCASYGSYLLADGDGTPDTVSRVLDAAVALSAPNVRVWAPFGVEPGSPRTGEVVDALQAVSAAAAARGLTVGVEFHGGTLTATADSATALLDAVGASNLWTYWQPPYWLPARAATADAAEVSMLGPRLSHVHVYEWATALDRRPLAEGEQRWRAVFRALGGTDVALPGAPAGCDVRGHSDRVSHNPGNPVPRVAFLEFVADDDPDALRRDAKFLHRLLGESS